MTFDFLTNLTLEEVEVNTRQRVGHYPTEGNDMRVFRTGKLYLQNMNTQKSYFDHLVEYKNEGEKQYGLDIIDSKEWSNFPDTDHRLLFFGFPEKGSPRVDLFSRGVWNEDGTPKTNHRDMTITNKFLADKLAEIYGEDIFVDGYVDLKLVEDVPMTTQNGIYDIPKTITRGPDKGSLTYERREYDKPVYAVAIANYNEVKEKEGNENTVKEYA